MSGYDYDDDFDNNDGFYDDDDDQEEATLSLIACGNCGRNFNEDSLARHSKICQNIKKRKPFNSKQQRLQGLEKPKATAASAAVSKKQPRKKDWRRQHQEFIKNIRAARDVTNAIKSGEELPPPPEPTINPDYIQCPHCERRFAESAAERHINFCKEQKSRLPKASSDSKFDQKKQKQSIRNNYRPPMPGQKKKTSSEIPSPVKARGSAGSHNNTRSPASRPPDGSPTTGPKSGTKKNSKSNAYQEEEKQLPTSNSRYSKSNHASSPSHDPDSFGKPRSSKTRIGSGGSGGGGGSEPKWFEDLQKRSESGKQRGRHLDDIDSGLDLNDNYSQRTPHSGKSRERNDHPVGVVRPSSHTKDKGFFDDDSTIERSPASAGRRQKMANFCHDCGMKYPVPSAKFCCECGLKRVVLA